MNPYPDRRCDVPGCDTDKPVLVVLERHLCVPHIQEFEEWENLLARRRYLVRQWLEHKREGKR